MLKQKIFLLGLALCVVNFKGGVQASSDEDDISRFLDKKPKRIVSSMTASKIPPSKTHNKSKLQSTGSNSASSQTKPRKKPVLPVPSGQRLISTYLTRSAPSPSLSIVNSSPLSLGEDSAAEEPLSLSENVTGFPSKPLTRLLKRKRASVAYLPQQTKATPGTIRRAPYAIKTDIKFKDDSDSETAPLEKGKNDLKTKFPHFPSPVVPMGTQVKLLANVYLKNLDETANIFLPYYTLKGLTTTHDFFRTPKGQICVFASGGFQNVWEKTVGSVQNIFFGDRVKIIRASWIRKHLHKDLETEFRGREKELHSELYYDLFFQHFFLPSFTQKQGKSPCSLTISAFSWWDVCTQCDERYLEKHRSLLSPSVKLSYEIAASRRYFHHYPSSSVIKEARIPPSEETRAWDEIWAKVSGYVHKKFENKKGKKEYWTATKEGLEICKWMGQAFVENKSTLKEGRAKPARRGDILKFYQQMTGKETQPLEELLSYLQKKNWELSCWYRCPYPKKVQPLWKTYWRQLVIPHFGWEEVEERKLEDEETDFCQMCGKEDLRYVFWVFHPKFRVSESFLTLPKEEREMNERDQGYTLDTSPDELPPVLQKKRKQSLWVGSECVKVLTRSHEALKGWRANHPENIHRANWEERATREEELEALNQVADAELKKRRPKKKRKKKKTSSEKDEYISDEE